MSKKNLLIGTGTFALAIAAVFAVKASAKFGNATSLFVSTNNGCRTLNSSLSSSSVFTTVGGIGQQQATIVTVGGIGTRKLYAVACTGMTSKPVYFHQ